uniref:Ketoreductase domain-containing protein n=1 Tax=Peronospora matthiolae TaxID=2874970 RepID=A0AAV1VHP6_9STRA
MTAKTVLVTGSNRGIGLSLAAHYKNEGWQVIGCARNVDGATDLQRLEPWKLVTLDTSSEESIAAVASTLQNVPIHLLINNAGVMDDHDLESTTKADLLRHYEVNAVGPFLMTRALLPNLRLAAAAEAPAFVAQLTSRMGCISANETGGTYGYRASKSALNMLSKCLAIDLMKENIGCLLLHPGYVKTAMVQYRGPILLEDSVKGLTTIIARAKLEDSAKVLHYEKGIVLPW